MNAEKLEGLQYRKKIIGWGQTELNLNTYSSLRPFVTLNNLYIFSDPLLPMQL